MNIKSLEGLPSELQYKTFDYLDESSKLNLLVCNRRIYDIFIPKVYEKIRLSDSKKKEEYNFKKYGKYIKDIYILEDTVYTDFYQQVLFHLSVLFPNKVFNLYCTYNLYEDLNLSKEELEGKDYIIKELNKSRKSFNIVGLYLPYDKYEEHKYKFNNIFEYSGDKKMLKSVNQLYLKTYRGLSQNSQFFDVFSNKKLEKISMELRDFNNVDIMLNRITQFNNLTSLSIMLYHCGLNYDTFIKFNFPFLKVFRIWFSRIHYNVGYDSSTSEYETSDSSDSSSLSTNESQYSNYNTELLLNDSFDSGEINTFSDSDNSESSVRLNDSEVEQIRTFIYENPNEFNRIVLEEPFDAYNEVQDMFSNGEGFEIDANDNISEIKRPDLVDLNIFNKRVGKNILNKLNKKNNNTEVGSDNGSEESNSSEDSSSDESDSEEDSEDSEDSSSNGDGSEEDSEDSSSGSSRVQREDGESNYGPLFINGDNYKNMISFELIYGILDYKFVGRFQHLKSLTIRTKDSKPLHIEMNSFPNLEDLKILGTWGSVSKSDSDRASPLTINFRDPSSSEPKRTWPLRQISARLFILDSTFFNFISSEVCPKLVNIDLSSCIISKELASSLIKDKMAVNVNARNLILENASKFLKEVLKIKCVNLKRFFSLGSDKKLFKDHNKIALHSKADKSKVLFKYAKPFYRNIK